MNKEILSNLSISKVYSVSSLYTPEGAGNKKNDRPWWAVILKYEGETRYTVNGRTFFSDPEHMVILPKGSSYEWFCTKSGHFFTLEFESPLTCREPLDFPIKNGKKFLELFKELDHKRNLKGPLSELESIRDAYSILLMLAQNEQERYRPSEKHRKIAPAIEYISQNYQSNFTNDELADLTGLSTVYFRKLFTDIMGTSPMAYARELRIRKAKEMLRSDYGTVSQVAHSLGYANVYDFSRDFKKHTGIAPSKY